MAWETHPLTTKRFDDFADVINKNRRSTHCWCLSHRINPAEIEKLGGDREGAMRTLAGRKPAPGVVTYLDGKPVGWCSIAPRPAIPRLAHSKLITPIDDLDVWSIICVVVRAGHRKQGVTTAMLDGACAYAFSHGAPAVEAYPAGTDERIDTTMAFVGTRSMFAKAGFTEVGTTKAVASGHPRIVMRRLPG